MNTRSKTGLYPRSFCKQKTLIPKGQNGLVSKLLNGFIGAAMAENPAVMTASGWRQNNTGEYVQDQQDSEGAKQLRDNLSSISEMSPTNPIGATLFGIGKGIQFGLQRLPEIQKILTHPTWRKIYHGSPSTFTWKEARNSSRSNIGLHVTPNKKVADSFNSGSPLLEGYAPKPKVETIDIGFNNYDLINHEYTIQARPVNSGNYYDTVLPDTKRIQMLKKAGAKPTVSVRINSKKNGNIYQLNTENSVNLNLQKELKLSKSAVQKANNIIQKSKTNFQNKDELLNKEATDLLSKDGIKTIKYQNVNPTEGGGGESWILTDPSIVWNPTWKPIGINLDLRRISPSIPLLHEKIDNATK